MPFNERGFQTAQKFHRKVLGHVCRMVESRAEELAAFLGELHAKAKDDRHPDVRCKWFEDSLLVLALSHGEEHAVEAFKQDICEYRNKEQVAVMADESSSAEDFISSDDEAGAGVGRASGVAAGGGRASFYAIADSSSSDDEAGAAAGGGRGVESSRPVECISLLSSDEDEEKAVPSMTPGVGKTADVAAAPTTMDSVSECVICLDPKPTCASVPCGHMCVCVACQPRATGKIFNCPVCREDVAMFMRVFP